jgi:hypothetical protein
MVQSHTSRNTVIIAIAAAASISASFAGYYAAEAEKYYALTNGSVTKAVRYEHQADLQVRRDEELLMQATIEYHRNETRVGDFLVSQLSEAAKGNMIIDRANINYSLMPSYYDKLYSSYAGSTVEEHDYLNRAELSDEYSRLSIIGASLLTAGVVIFSELTRKKENAAPA